MDRAYYHLIDKCTEAVRLSTAIVRNADYKEAIRTATDPLMLDCCRRAEDLRRILEEVINRQEYANVMSMPV